MKFFRNKVLVSLICTFAFAIAFSPAAYAVDGCSSAGFKVATNINLEATPFGIAVADFNGDGHLDLVAAPNNVSNEVLVLLGRGGTERFGPPTSYQAGGRSQKIAVGDFNGDAKPDLAVTLGQPSGKLSILLNDGTGKFGAPNLISLPGDPYFPVLGDVNNDGKPPAVTINDVVIAEGTQAQSLATFTISLNAPSGKATRVQYALQAGTASPNIDYTNVSGTVDFPAYTVSKTISIPIIQDNIFEPDETFFVNLSNALDLTIADGQGQGTISNDDPQPTIAIAPSWSRVEGPAGTTDKVYFLVTLSNPSYQIVRVTYSTADGTATAGTDYFATSVELAYNPGETTKSTPVEFIGDDTDEMHEIYFVNLSNPVNASIAAAQGVGTIVDDDGPTLSISSVAVTEGSNGVTFGVLTVTLSGPSVQDISVRYSTIDGTASSQGAGPDFFRIFPNSGFLFFPAGTTSKTLFVSVLGDYSIEPDEQFFVTLEQPSNATIANRLGTITIINDDAYGKLQFSSPTYSVSEDGGSVVVVVNRVDGASAQVKVNYATSNGTAAAGADYAATSGTLIFNQGEISKSFSIPIVNDNVLEGDETVNLTLSNPVCGPLFPGMTCAVTLGNPATATLTIKTPPLLLLLEESGPGPQQVAALDSLLFLRDPFRVIPILDLFNQGMDRNTRVLVFVTNLQLAPGDVASTVRVNLIDSNGQSYDVDAEDVRPVPPFNFMQVKFRLPDNLTPGVCNIKIRAHDQESNPGTIRIIN